MKILVISNYYPPYFLGGYEIACQITSQTLVERGHQVFVLTGVYGEESREGVSDIQSNVPYRKLHYIDYGSPNLRQQKDDVEKFNYRLTWDVIRQVRPDLVYLWNQKAVSIASVTAVQESGIRKIFHLGDFWPTGYLKPENQGWMKRWFNCWLPFLARKKMELDPVIVPSQWMVDEVKKRYASQDIMVIPHGIAVPEVQPVRDWESSLRFMFSGRLDPDKGLEIAIEAFHLLVQEKWDYVFDVFGDGNTAYVEHCKGLVEKYQLRDRIRFYGRVQNINDYYLVHDILLMPTLMKEPFGKVIIEAMAYGMVVVASNGYGPAEVIRDQENGVLFETRNPNDLAAKIQYLVENRECLPRLAKNGLDKVIRDYSLDREQNQIEQALQRMVNRKR